MANLVRFSGNNFPPLIEFSTVGSQPGQRNVDDVARETLQRLDERYDFPREFDPDALTNRLLGFCV